MVNRISLPSWRFVREDTVDEVSSDNVQPLDCNREDPSDIQGMLE